MLDEVLVVENEFEVLLRVVIELNKISGAMVRKSWKQMPWLLLFSPWEKNLKSRLILSSSEDLKILANLGLAYTSR